MSASNPSLLGSVRDAVGNLAASPATVLDVVELETFFSPFLDLGLVYGTDARWLPEVDELVSTTAAAINDSADHLVDYPRGLVAASRGIYEADEWRLFCQRRSALQFFLDLYRDTDAWPVIQAIERSMGEVDLFARERGATEGYMTDADIDPAIPADHWWWWMPASPPASRRAG